MMLKSNSSNIMRTYFALFFLLIFQLIQAQQDAQYTHYAYNMSLVNPAYTVSDYGEVKFGAVHRNQWVGVQGAPTSTMAFGQAALKNNINVGFSFINDNIGDVIKENNIFADVAYKLPVSYDKYLSFGLKAGVRFFNANFSNFNLQSGNSSTDVAFQQNINQQFFNLGAGIYYNTEAFYIGFSVPNIIESKYFDQTTNTVNGTEAIHAFLTSGYVFNINEKLKFKPTLLLKGVKGAPLSLDVNANVLINNKLGFGLGYRLEDAIMALANFNITQSLTIGYAYDYNLSELNTFNSGSHEILLLFNLNTLNNGYDKSPRFF